jgi:hypothetical protein
MEKLQNEIKLLNERMVAEMLNCSVAKLQADRHYNRGLPYIRLGRHVKYRLFDIYNHINDNVVMPSVT